MAAIRALIVDDAAWVRQDLRTVLTLAGETGKEKRIEIVGEAADGMEAIRQADVLQPDVILMDLEMPVLEGYKAAQQIKAHIPACRVIALTVHDYEAARRKAFEARMDDFIVKGTDVCALVQVISGIKKEGVNHGS